MMARTDLICCGQHVVVLSFALQAVPIYNTINHYAVRKPCNALEQRPKRRMPTFYDSSRQAVGAATCMDQDAHAPLNNAATIDAHGQVHIAPSTRHALINIVFDRAHHASCWHRMQVVRVASVPYASDEDVDEDQVDDDEVDEASANDDVSFDEVVAREDLWQYEDRHKWYLPTYAADDAPDWNPATFLHAHPACTGAREVVLEIEISRELVLLPHPCHHACPHHLHRCPSATPTSVPDSGCKCESTAAS